MAESLSYKQAGVNIDAGNLLVDRIKQLVPKTHRPGVVGSIGGFAGAFAMPTGYQEPLLMAATDGVGTKLRLAIETGQHAGIGIDLVAMCVNDLIVTGAEPLFFLDYFATGQLDVEVASVVIEGIVNGCQQAGAALIGGETAEMPGMYAKSDYDLAGFCVGVVDKPRLIDGSTISPGDELIALASSGAHANGYSLIRMIHQQTPYPHVAELLTPTKIYVKPVLSLVKENLIKGMAHITGGGFIENIPRMLPKGTAACVDMTSYTLPALFQWLQQQGNLSLQELRRTFNCGVGMVLCVAKENVQTVLQSLASDGEQAWVLGRVEAAGDQPIRFING